MAYYKIWSIGELLTYFNFINCFLQVMCIKGNTIFFLRYILYPNIDQSYESDIQIHSKMISLGDKQYS